jgi:hypothetical protein
VIGDIPKPGSPEAVDQGCTCPIMDNAYGQGIDGSFWLTDDCPLHGFDEIFPWRRDEQRQV